MAMNLTFSLTVLFLLFLKGVFVQTETVFFPPGSVCAPEGSDVTLGYSCSSYTGWIFHSWKLRINNKETIADPSKDSRYSYFKDAHHRCFLIIHGLKETDAGTYYMSFFYRNGIFKSRLKFTVHVTDLQVSVDSDHVTEGQNVTLTCKTSCPLKQTFVWFKNGVGLGLSYSSDQLHVSAEDRVDSDRYSCALRHFEAFPSAETLLDVTHVAYTSAGIITLSSLLIPVVLLLVCAALWMIKTKQKRRSEVKEQSKQHENVYENVSAPPVTFDLEEKGKSVHQKEEVQYSCVHFSKFTNGQCSATSENEDDVQYAQITVKHQKRSKY